MNLHEEIENESMALTINLPVATITLLMMLTPLSGCLNQSDSTPATSDYPNSEGLLRINHIQMKGTHNSYHIEPLVSPTREYMYTHEDLDIQASQLGVRQFEIDFSHKFEPLAKTVVIHCTRLLKFPPSEGGC